MGTLLAYRPCLSMTTTVHVYGAGSIGNHLTHACRAKDWDVTVIDQDPAALERMRTSIYPSRYGSWDRSIRLTTPAELGEPAPHLVILGTPPDSHMGLALSILERGAPKAMLVEKPLCTPNLSDCDLLDQLATRTGTHVLVGYNHTLVPASVAAATMIRSGALGRPLTLIAEFREYWGGIFSAHPWLSGPADSYLGFWQRGGGASGEHSHAMNIFQFFASVLGAGRVTEVTALLDYVEQDGCAYDRLCQLHVRTESGLAGSIVQDVITEPPQKRVRVQGDRGFVEWYVNYQKDQDRVVSGSAGGPAEHVEFPKTRPDDFRPEIDHVERLLTGLDAASESPIHLHRGLETMLVIAAAHRSAATKRPVYIDYAKGWTEKALTL
jgi:predicted dehydrogenase